MKVYITRDEGSGDRFIWLWLRPEKGTFKPSKMKDCDWIIWHRPGSESMDLCDCYNSKDFKIKFGKTIKPKTRKLIDIPESLIKSEDFKLFSNDSKRRKE